MDNILDALISYKGQWASNTIYEVGDYVYLKNKRPGYFYKCIVSGRSQSSTSGKSGTIEPTWAITGNCYDNVLVWNAVKLDEVTSTNIRKWQPSTIYTVGSYVFNEDGTYVTIDDVQYVFQLTSILLDYDWPKVAGAYQIDNTVTWECYLSIGYYLPAERLKEETFYEFVLMMDYLILHEKVYFDDFVQKYKDITKVRTKSLKEIVAEEGFKYVADVLSLTRHELETLVKYISVINDLKGSLSGLEVVFNMIGIKYNMVEWWEKAPQGTPHTFDLAIEVDIDKVALNMMTNLKNFIRNYVYPVIENFEITYKMNIAQLAIILGGFIDIELPAEVSIAPVLASSAGFIDIELPSEMIIDNYMQFYVFGGFIDIELSCSMDTTITNISRSFGTATTYLTAKTSKSI
jgi:hypothetical protein